MVTSFSPSVIFSPRSGTTHRIASITVDGWMYALSTSHFSELTRGLWEEYQGVTESLD